jgi:MFS family permease
MPPRTRPSVDGGPRGWAAVAGGAIAGAVGLGTVSSHGVLVSVLEGETLLGVGLGALLVAISTTLQFTLGPVVGRLTERLGIPALLILAAVVYATGAMGAALLAPPWGVVAYAVGTGMAGAITLAPVLATAAGWFRQRRGQAVAVVSAGNGLGALLLAPWLATSVDTRGLRVTWLTLAMAGGVTLALTAVVVRRPPALVPVAASGFRLRTLLADPALRRLYVSGVFASSGVIAGLTYLVPFASSLDLGPARAASLLGIAGAAGIVSRLAVAAIPDHATFAAYRASLVAQCATASLWLAAPIAPLLLTVFAVAFGLATGLWSALAPLVVARSHADRLASILGALFTAVAIGGTLGPVTASALLRVAPPASVGLLLGLSLLAAHHVLRPPGHHARGHRPPPAHRRLLPRSEPA